MAKWEVVAQSRGPTGSYIGWRRKHPQIHMLKEPMGKISLVQVHHTANNHQVLAQTVAHSVFAQPSTRGTTLFRKVVNYKTEKAANKAVARFKALLAKKFDKVTGTSRR